MFKNYPSERHIFSLSLVVFLLLVIPLTVISVLNSSDPRSKAATAKNSSSPTPQASSTLSAPTPKKTLGTADTVLGVGDCTTNPALDDQEVEFLRLINNHRAANGLAALSVSYTLSKAAQWKSEDLGRNAYFAHDDLNRTWVQRIRDCGYGFNAWLGENIAGGVSNAQAAFDLFKNSPGHNANMLGGNYYAIGIGRAFVAGSPFGWYWTTEFGSHLDSWPDSLAPSVSIASPSAGATLTGTVNVQVSTSDNFGVLRVEFYRNTSRVFTSTAPPFSYLWNTTSVSDGTYSLTAKAFDVAGNVGTSAPVSVTVRNLDSDGDGFSDSAEAFIGTNPNLRCGLNAWPPDVNNSGKVDSVDIARVRAKFGLSQGSAGYLARYDLTADGKMDQTDISIVRSYFNRTCS